ncbi:MAG: hypothetical protein VX920_01375 [Pseudomonadota bacterium]|nr:hypothetical protein [Pseudomonadota bacterium]
MAMRGLLAGLGLFGMVSAAAVTVQADRDGCWAAPDWCLQVEDSHWEGDRFAVRYRNVCEHRLYVKHCNQLKGGRWACEGGAIAPSLASTRDSHDATGSFHYRFVGSLEASRDWVCADKESGWSRAP